MASTATSTMLAATINYRGPEIFDQVFLSHPLLAWLKEKKSVQVWEGGGENIETIIETGGNTTMAVRDYKEAIPQREVNPVQTVYIPRMFINGSITWYNAQEEANVGKFKIIDFVNTLIDNGASSMAEIMSSEVWQSGSVSGHMLGIPAVLGFATKAAMATASAATNTYMTVDRSVATNSWWRARAGSAQYTTANPVTAETTTYGSATGWATAEPLVLNGGTDGGVRSLYNDCCANGGTDPPDFGITTLTLFNKLCALVEAEFLRPQKNERLSELGYPENLQFQNAAIVWDREAPAGSFTLLNSKYLKLRPYAGYSTTIKRTGIVSLEPLGIMGKSTFLQWCGNMSCSKPQRCGALTAKTV